jgi:SMC interacting uncharacterized protein involved in chromosome segregation
MTAIDIEISKLQNRIENLEKRQDKMEIEFKAEISNIKNDIKDLKKEIQNDIKDLKKIVDEINIKVIDLKSFDVNQQNTYKVLTVVATVIFSIISVAIQYFMK